MTPLLLPIPAVAPIAFPFGQRLLVPANAPTRSLSRRRGGIKSKKVKSEESRFSLFTFLFLLSVLLVVYGLCWVYVRYELAWCDEYEYGDCDCDDVDDYDGCYVDFDGYACYVISFGFEFDDV